MKFKKTLIAATLLLSVTSAHAELVETDWKNTGDALATLDTGTGIEWLDLTQTDNMSITQAEGLTVTGGAFEGWRLPTRAEVTQMMVTVFSSQASLVQGAGGFNITSATTKSEAHLFSALFGITAVNSIRNHTYGIFKGGQGTSVLFSAATSNKGNNTDYNVTLYSNNGAANDYNFSNASYGVYLVSDGGTTRSSQLDPSLNANNANSPTANVSAPALLGLMGLGLFGFAARRRSLATLNK
jgi:MYXO-CTERM domain-containing protein